MTTLNDARFDALRALGHTGTTNDMLIQWLESYGAVGGQLSDLWHDLLLEIGAGGNGFARNDMWFTLLGVIGLEGSINDRELQFWRDEGGVIPPQAFDVWDDALIWDDLDTWNDVLGPTLL